MRFEQHRLTQAGQEKLAERVEQVAVTQGGGLGFDIHSFETNGRDRLIEVKTTDFPNLPALPKSSGAIWGEYDFHEVDFAAGKTHTQWFAELNPFASLGGG